MELFRLHIEQLLRVSSAHQPVVLNSNNDVGNARVIDYDGGEIRLVSVVLADVLFDPITSRVVQRTEQEN
jgi:hypothetical protein